MAKRTSEFDRAYAAALAQTGIIMRGSMPDALWHDLITRPGTVGDDGGGGNGGSGGGSGGGGGGGGNHGPGGGGCQSCSTEPTITQTVCQNERGLDAFCEISYIACVDGACVTWAECGDPFLCCEMDSPSDLSTILI